MNQIVAIRSVDRFLELFPVGSEFFCIEHLSNEPTKVIGPLRITSFEPPNTSPPSNVRFVYPDGFRGEERIDDLVKRRVYPTFADAEQHLRVLLKDFLAEVSMALMESPSKCDPVRNNTRKIALNDEEVDDGCDSD